MAAVVSEPNGRKYVQLNELPNRPKVRLGTASKKVAEAVRVKLEALVASKFSGQPLDKETAAWASTLSEGFLRRLVAIGLLTAPEKTGQPESLSRFLERYVDSRAKLKPNTLRNYGTSKRLLIEYFGQNQPVDSIHAGQARDYREWLVGKYSPANVAREVKRARQFFEYAKDCRLIDKNPFAKIKAGSQKNSSRKFFVSREVISAVLDACPNNEWRLIVAMARFAGLRIPSELVDLTWDRINWEGNRFTVNVPKKEHLDGQGTREMPIFPELRPFLEKAFDEAAEGSVWVVPRAHSGTVNLRTGLEKILKRAGIAQWPKLFHNLRASRETELMRTEPAHVVYHWLGNSREVAQDHYLMVTEADYERATQPPSGKAVQKAVQSAAVRSNLEPSPENESAVSPAITKDTAVQVPPRGVEPRFSD